MISKIFNGRIRMKIDTTANWRLASDFIPLQGEIIVYSDFSEKEVNGETVKIPNFKIGDGLAYGIDLPFVGDDVRNDLLAHMDDRNIHITNAEREFWNNKVRCYVETNVETINGESVIVDGENLIFTTH